MATPDAAEVTVRVADASVAATIDAELLSGSDPKAENDWDAGERVRAEPFDDLQLRGGTASLRLPRFSFAAASLRLGQPRLRRAARAGLLRTSSRG